MGSGAGGRRRLFAAAPPLSDDDDVAGSTTDKFWDTASSALPELGTTASPRP